MHHGVTLILDTSTQFKGTVAGLYSVAPFDTIDLVDIAGASAKISNYAPNATGGTLTVTANIALLGQYSLASFAIASDGHGGTAFVDPLAVQRRSRRNRGNRSVGQCHEPGQTMAGTAISAGTGTTLTSIASTNGQSGTTVVDPTASATTNQAMTVASTTATTATGTTSPTLDTTQASNTNLLVNQMASTIVASSSQTVTSTVDPTAASTTQTPTLTHPLAA